MQFTAALIPAEEGGLVALNPIEQLGESQPWPAPTIQSSRTAIMPILVPRTQALGQ